MMKPKYTNVTTPFCEGLYIHIAKQDVYEGQECGYSVTLLLDPDNEPEHQKFCDKVRGICQEAFDTWANDEATPAQKKRYSLHMPIKEHFDKEGNPTGLMMIKATTKMEPKVYNSAVEPISHKSCAGLRKGTTIVMKIALKSVLLAQKSACGCVAYISAIQIVEPVYNSSDEMSGGGGGDSGGFEKYDTSNKITNTPSTYREQTGGDDNFDTGDIPF